MKKSLFFVLAFFLFLGVVHQVYALSLNMSTLIQNTTLGGSYSSSTTLYPGNDVSILFSVANPANSGETAGGLSFAPSDLLFGEINNYLGDATKTLKLAGVWRSPSEFQIHTNTQAQQNFLYGNMTPGTNLSILVYFKIPSNYNNPTQTLTLTPFCTPSGGGACTIAGSATRTFSVNVSPVLSNAAFTNAIIRDGSNSTGLTVTASDPSGLGDIANIKVDLSPLGGSNAYLLYDDGTHGDGAAADGVFGVTGISTTTASIGSYSLTLTATDSGGNIGTIAAPIAVEAAGSPVVSLVSQTHPVLSLVTGYTTDAITWQSTLACGPAAGQGYRIMLGGTAGDPTTGTILTDWQLSGCLANTQRTDTISQASLATGVNTVYIYVKTTDNYLGYLSITLTKDTTNPTIIRNSYTTSILGTNNGSFIWRAAEAGTYTVTACPAAGSPLACTGAETQVTGTNASGSYTANDVAYATLIPSQFLNADLTEGTNLVFVHFTDLGGNVSVNSTSSSQITVTKDSTPPVSSVSTLVLADTDTVFAGVDGHDFTVTWAQPADLSNVTGYRVYFYTSVTSYLATDAIISTLPVGTTTYTWDENTLTSSKGVVLAAGNYRAVVVTLGQGSYENSGALYSNTTTIASEDQSPPAFVSAKFVSGDRIQITFDKNLSTNLADHDATKITSTDFTINSALGTNGVQSVNGMNIFFHINPLNNLAKVSSTLNFAATYQQDSIAPDTHNKPITAAAVRAMSGVLGPVASRGTFDVNTAIVNPTQDVSADVTGQSVTDGQAPNPLAIVVPAINTKTTASSLNFQYTLPEAMNAATLKLQFVRTGGATDGSSPHTVMLTNAGVGTFTQAITLTSFTSLEHGAADALVNGGVYTLQIMGSDLAANQATTVSTTGFMYDSIAPTTAVLQRYPVGAPSNNYWTNNNAPLLQWAASTDINGIDHYLVQIASDNGFALVQAFTTTAGTSWQVPSALGDGVYYWRVLAYDPAGNVSTAQAPVEGFIVDTTGPSITINATPSVRTLTSLTVDLAAATDGASGVGNNMAGYLYSLSKTDADCVSNPMVSGFTTATSYPFASLVANTNYCFKVQAKDGLGNLGAWSATQLIGTLANQVSGFGATSNYTTQHNIALSWTNQGQSGVKIEQDNGCDGSYETTPFDNAANLSTSLNITSGLSANTCYQFRIDSYNLNGALNGTLRPTVQVTTLPAMPTGLINNTNTETSISYDWADVVGATGYKVYQTDASGNNPVLISSPAVSTFTKTGLTANSQYCIKASAVSTVGEGPATAFICAYASANIPVNLTASSKTVSSILWSWLSGGAQSFFYAFTNTPAANSGWIPGLSWNQPTLSANTQYQCFVKAKNADGDETATVNLFAYTAIENPAITLGTISSTSIALSSAVSNLGGNSALFFDNTTSSLNSGWITLSSWENTSLTPNTQYTFRVKARNGDLDETAYSATISKYTYSAIPTLTVGESVSDTQLSVRILANSNPSGTAYQIYRSITGTGNPTSSPADWTQVQDWTAHTNNDTFFDTGLTPGASYFYLARTRNGEGVPVVSAWGAAASVSTDSSALKLEETTGKVTNSWYNGASLDLTLHTNSIVGVAYYRYKFDSSAITDLNLDATCIAPVDAQLGKWGTGGNPVLMTTDLTQSFNTTGIYYGHFVACSAGLDATVGTADDVRTNNITNPQVNFGPFSFDKDNPTITNDYAFSGTLKAATQTITLTPDDAAGSGIAEVRYCIDDVTNDCVPATVLAAPYQFSYSTTIDQFVRYQAIDTAGNSSAVGSYHIMIDAVAPVISTVSSAQISGVLKTPTDNIYQTGDTVRIKVVEQNTELGLTGTIQITSVLTTYDSGVQALLYDGVNNLYYYDWDTTGRTQSPDYIVTVTLADSVTNTASNNGLVIHLDTTVPSVTAFQVSDVSSASTIYTNNRTLTVDSFTSTDADSTVAYYRIGDAAGNVAAPAVTPADFTLTSAPANYDLTAAEGLVSVFAWTMDAANNIAVPSKQLITLDLTAPNISAFTLADQTSASTSYTNFATVNIPVLAASDATTTILKYLVNESASAPTVAVMNSTGVPAAPGSYTITGGEGLRTVYVWAMDAAENIGSRSTTITYDITPPIVNSVKYLDNDLDGQMDRIKIQFSESVKTLTGSVVNGNGFSVVGHSIQAGTGVLSTTVLNNDTLTLQIDETGVETASMPDLTYLAINGDIQDLSENMLADVTSGAIIESDGVAPVKTGLNMEDTNGNGKVDRITVTYSENLQAIANDAAHWTVANIPSAGTVTSVTATAGTPNVLINISEGAGAADTAVNSLTVALHTASAVQDAAGNTVITFTALAPTDAAKPVFMARQTYDLDGNGKLDAIKIAMSEPISDFSLTAAHFILSVGNARSVNGAYTGAIGGVNFVNGVATGNTADDSNFYIKLTEGTLVDTGDLPTISYTQGTLADISTLLASTASNLATTDNAKPVLTTVTVRDTNSDGSIETAEFRFSEFMNDSSLTASGWAIQGSAATGFSTTVQGDADANDDLILVSLTNGVTGTASATADVTYSATTGGFTDSHGVALADRLSASLPNEIDKAAPIITSVVYSDNGTAGDVTDDTISLSFSESIDDASLNLTAGNADIDFSVIGGGAITAATTFTGNANDNAVTIQLNAGDTALTAGVSAISLLASAISDLASPANISTSTAAVTSNGALVINEIAWGGTSASTTTDEYIELRNLSASLIDFSVTPFVLYINGSLWKLIDSGSVPANGYFLVSRYDSTDGASSLLNISVLVNHIKDAALAAIPDTALQVKLYKGATSAGLLFDTADDGVGTPFAGSTGATYASMERNNASGSGTVASSWHTANGSVNLQNTAVKGTPKSVNVTDSQAPSFGITPETRTPTPNALRPDSQPTIAVNYADNTGGSGINTAQVKLYLDLDDNVATSGTVGSTTLTGCETDKTAQSTITATRISLVPSAPLAAGRYRACVLIQDVAENEATISWDFWVDNFTMAVTEVVPAHMVVQAGVDAEIVGVTKLTVSTYGAGLDITGTFPALTYGANTINKSAVFYSSLLQKQIGAGALVQQHGYGAYLDTNVNSQVETISAEVLDVTTNNQIKTYEVYMRYKISGITAVQAAGLYTGSVGFNVGMGY